MAAVLSLKSIEARLNSVLSLSPLALPAICFVISFALHAHTIVLNGFVWDDRAALLMNADAQAQRPLYELWRHDFWGQDIRMHDSHKSYRPLAILSLRLNYLLHGLSPYGYHFVNVVLHSSVCALFASFASSVTQRHYSPPSSSSSSSASVLSSSSHFLPALLASLLFSVHPIHTEPVSCIVGRSDVLCGFFYLCAIVRYERALRPESPEKDRARDIAVALVLGVFAALSKEIGVTVFGVFVSYDIILATTSKTSKTNKQPSSLLELCRFLLSSMYSHFSQPSHFFRVSASLFLSFAYTLLHLSLHGGHAMYKWTIFENDVTLLPSFSSRVMSYAHIHSLYMYKLFVPYHLCYDYGWPCVPPVVNALDYRNTLSIFSYSLLLHFAYRSFSSRNALRLWAGALTVVPFLPASNALFPVGTILGERLLYLPSVGFCLGAGSLVYEGALYLERNAENTKNKKKKKDKEDGGRGAGAGATGVLVFALLVMLLFAGKSVHRCYEWRDETSLFTSALDVCPTSLKVLNNLALMFMQKKETALQAGALLDTALDLHPQYVSALMNRGLVHYVMGNHLQAMRSIEASLALDPNQPKARTYVAQSRFSLALKLEKEGDAEAARDMLEASLKSADDALRTGANLPLSYQVRCVVGHELGLLDENLWYCDKAIERNRELKESLKIGIGEPGELISEENAHNAAALTLRDLGKVREASERYEMGLEANPNCFEILVNAGGLSTDMRRGTEAMAFYSRALAIQPDSPELVTNIGWLLEMQGNLHSARDHYARALELLKPYSHVQIVNNLRNVEVRIAQGMGGDNV